MRFLAILAAGAIALGAATAANAAPLSNPGLTNATPIVLAQAKKETTVQKVKRSAKRAWKRVAGYKFNVSCLLSKSVCTETGDSREAARGKCMAAHPLCMVNDAK